MASSEKDRFGDKLRDAERASEDVYFAEQDRKMLKKLHAGEGGELETQQREAALMRCPKCGVRLDHVVQQGVAVEACPQCKGVWLDADEMEQLAGRENEGWIARWLRSEFRKKA